MTPPCGVPQVLFFPPLTRGLPFPSRSSTGTFNHILIRCSMSRSTIRRATHCINSRCGIVSKYLDKSASTTSVLPAWSSSCTFWIASCALRFGRARARPSASLMRLIVAVLVQHVVDHDLKRIGRENPTDPALLGLVPSSHSVTHDREKPAVGYVLKVLFGLFRGRDGLI